MAVVERPWSDSDIETVRLLYQGGASPSAISSLVGRTPNAVHGLMQRQRIYREPSRVQPWHPLRDNMRLLKFLGART